MNNYKKSEFYELCRFCMSASGKKYNILNDQISVDEVDFATKLNKCLNLQIKDNDMLPKKICENCVKKVEEIYGFLKQCELNDSELKNDNLISNIFNQIKNQREIISNLDEKEDSEIEMLPSFYVGRKIIQVEFNKTDHYQISDFKSEMVEDKKELNEFSLPDEVFIACTECGLILENLKEIMMHGQECKALNDINNHKDTLTQISKNVKLPKFSCKTCGKRFWRKYYLTRHTKMFAHHLARPYRCKICLKSYKRNEHLKRHSLSHLVQK